MRFPENLCAEDPGEMAAAGSSSDFPITVLRPQRDATVRSINAYRTDLGGARGLCGEQFSTDVGTGCAGPSALTPEVLPSVT